MTQSKARLSQAGKYFMMAQLTLRDFSVETVKDKYGQTRILAKKKALNSIEIIVKTSASPLINEALFSDIPIYPWVMNQKHETIIEDNLYYCFVNITDPSKTPLFFIVPSDVVAEYVKWQHEYWLESRKSPVNSTEMRRFRISENDPNQYLNNWSKLG